jgi:NAD(P)-dependent dehydrogenase (short-subunit alcohol dehydrogenase family)
MSDFRDRVAVITGAGSGIGGQLARLLAAEGARIAAVDVQQAGLDTLARDLPGKPIATATADVTNLPAMREAVARLEAQLGPADLLIASAGVGRSTPAEGFDAEDINQILRINLLGVVNAVDTVLAGMRQRRRGHLVGLSSLASYRGLPMMAAYCASKAGVNALFDSLRVELPPFNIAVTTICPGWVRTPMTAPLGLPDRATVPVEKAAGIILDAIRRQRPFVAFPANMVFQVRLLKYLPRPISDWLAGRRMEQTRRMMLKST